MTTIFQGPPREGTRRRRPWRPEGVPTPEPGAMHTTGEVVVGRAAGALLTSQRQDGLSQVPVQRQYPGGVHGAAGHLPRGAFARTSAEHPPTCSPELLPNTPHGCSRELLCAFARSSSYGVQRVFAFPVPSRPYPSRPYPVPSPTHSQKEGHRTALTTPFLVAAVVARARLEC
jgi:hypothetical protein